MPCPEFNITLRQVATDNKAIAWVVEKTEVITPIGRTLLLDSLWCKDIDTLQGDYERIQRVLQLQVADRHNIENLQHLLMCVRDVRATIAALKNKQTLGDIELFEIKALALTAADTKKLLLECRLHDLWAMPDISEAVGILDPENTHVAQFYIYDAYSPTLKHFRSELRKAKTLKSPDEAEWYAKCSAEEHAIRQSLTNQLYPLADSLEKCLLMLGQLDVVQAKAKLSAELALIRPDLKPAGTTLLRALWNPPVQQALKNKRREFQPVDIEINNGVTVITGANMAGKSVVLKTVALAQRMAQFGYFVPAAEAVIVPVSAVLESIGDGQSELEGMSSYAAEMQRIDFIINNIRDGKRCLALIDEPARTTNPEEGKALVNAIVELLDSNDSKTLLSTHYSGLTTRCHRLRVRGFRKELIRNEHLTTESVNDCIDYSLVPTDDSEAPRQALLIASLLGVNDLITTTAARYLDNTTKTSYRDAKE